MQYWLFNLINYNKFIINRFLFNNGFMCQVSNNFSLFITKDIYHGKCQSMFIFHIFVQFLYFSLNLWKSFYLKYVYNYSWSVIFFNLTCSYRNIHYPVIHIHIRKVLFIGLYYWKFTLFYFHNRFYAFCFLWRRK